MSETRKIAAILAADVVGFSRLAGADEDRTLARLRALRSDLVDPTIAVHNGRVFKRTGDGFIVEFRSVVDAVRCAIEIQNAMGERNAGVAADKRIELRSRRSSRRRRRGGGRRSHGRWRQHRRAARGRRRAGRDLPLRRRLSSGSRQGEGDRSSISAKRRSRTLPGRCASTRRLSFRRAPRPRRCARPSSPRPLRARRSPSCRSPT